MHGRSSIPFLAARTGAALGALAEAKIFASSAGCGWADLHVEVGRNGAWEVDDVIVPRHYLALNTDAVPLAFEAKVGRAFRRVVLAPGEMWFCPAGEPFSHRVATSAGFALVTLQPSRLARVVADERSELRRTYSIARPQLEHLVRALAAEVERGGPGGALFVDALATALAVQLSGLFGRRVASSGATPRLDERALRRVLEEIDARLGDSVLVADLARTAGLSEAHFARAFKRATRESPHRFVIRRRLEEARKALEQRDPDLLNVALRFGFSDQAHFARWFKRQFGVPPGRFVRARAR